jgi:hypothetical protein
MNSVSSNSLSTVLQDLETEFRMQQQLQAQCHSPLYSSKLIHFNSLLQ